jgi:hypothetical protein
MTVSLLIVALSGIKLPCVLHIIIEIKNAIARAIRTQFALHYCIRVPCQTTTCPHGSLILSLQLAWLVLLEPSCSIYISLIYFTCQAILKGLELW